jgi:hypothetical protein
MVINRIKDQEVDMMMDGVHGDLMARVPTC